MQQLEPILKKIEESIAQKIDEVKKEVEQKKFELKQKYDTLLEQSKLNIKSEFQQKLELAKKRIYSETVVEFNKKVEEIKNQLLANLLDQIKHELLNLNKNEYYQLVKNFLEKNIFHNEHNVITFDSSGKISKEEQKKLVNEVVKNLKNTTAEVKDTKTTLEFGVKIVAGKKIKEFTLQTLLEFIKPYCEKEVNNLIRG